MLVCLASDGWGSFGAEGFCSALSSAGISKLLRSSPGSARTPMRWPTFTALLPSPNYAIVSQMQL